MTDSAQETIHNPFGQGEIPKRTLRIGAAIIGFVIVAFVLVPGILMAITPHPHGTLYEIPKPPAPDFTLQRADGGGDFRLSDGTGKVRVLYFGYTSCPDVCPTTLYDLRNTMKELGADASDVQVLFVTIDPEVDTPERLTEYLSHFDPDFIGLTGDEATLEAIYADYGVVVRRADEGEVNPAYGSITHTNSMFVIDQDGNLTLRMHHDTEVEFLVRDLRYVLKGRL